jgi:hypothetical protein
MKPTCVPYLAQVYGIKCCRCDGTLGPYLDADQLISDAVSECMWEFQDGEWLCGECVEDTLDAQLYFHNRQLSWLETCPF